MNKKYRHPWLPYPYMGVLVLISLWLLFINNGWIGIIVLWFYRLAYLAISSISWEKRKQKRLYETEQSIIDGEPCIFPNPKDVIDDFGAEKGRELLKTAQKNVNNSYAAREKTLIDFKEKCIRDSYFNDCEIWNSTWNKIITMPWVNVKDHNSIEKLLQCSDPNTLRPDNWDSVILTIRRMNLSDTEKMILNNNMCLNKKNGGLDVEKLPQSLIEEYKLIAYKIVPWNISYEEKEKKMKLFKNFVCNPNNGIEYLGIKEEDLR